MDRKLNWMIQIKVRAKVVAEGHFLESVLYLIMNNIWGASVTHSSNFSCACHPPKIA